MRAATLESRLEDLGVLRSSSWPRASNDNLYSESLFRTVKFRPDYARRPFTRVEEACVWVAAFVNWYNDRHRHCCIRFVTPSQRHSGEAVAISHHHGCACEQARHVTHAAGVAALTAGVNRRRFGLIRHYRKTALLRLPC